MAKLGEVPKPPEKMTLKVVGGASLTGMMQLPRGMPDECSMAFNLMLQLGPLLGSLDCLMKLFAFVGKIVEVVNSAPDPFAVGDKLLGAVPAAGDMAECVYSFSPPGMCPPIKSMLVLIHRFLSCIVEAIDSVVSQRMEIAIQMGEAQGNPELLEVLQLAEANADHFGMQSLQSCGPAMDLLQTFGGLIQAVGGGAIEVPSLDDLAGGDLREALQPLKDLLDVLQAVIDILPC